jgi:septal ring factor EnvC (AmiA/AmiB activator)
MAGVVGVRDWKVAGLVLLMVSSAAWAGGGQVQAHQTHSAVATQASLAQAKQQLEQQQAQVRQLQDTVAKQESDSKQASQRLQQQDQTIAKMQQELQALHTKPAVGHR